MAMVMVLQGLGLICPGAETHSCDCIAWTVMLPAVLAWAPWHCHSYCGYFGTAVAIARLLQCKGMCFGCFNFEIGKETRGCWWFFPSSFG